MERYEALPAAFHVRFKKGRALLVKRWALEYFGLGWFVGFQIPHMPDVTP